MKIKIFKISLFLGSTLLLSFASLSTEINQSSNKLLMKEEGKATTAFKLKKSVLKSKSKPLDYIYLAKKKTSSLAIKKSPPLALPKVKNNQVSPSPANGK